jgi:hypothetical protein
VLHYAHLVGIEHLAPHDLRRTCAKLCRKSGGDLEQIQFLLGQSSIQTTEKYLGGEQDIVNAVNDRILRESRNFKATASSASLFCAVRFADSCPKHECHHLNDSEVTIGSVDNPSDQGGAITS